MERPHGNATTTFIDSRHGINTADSPLIIGFTVRLCKHACLSGSAIIFFHAVLCARSLGSTQLLYQRNGSGKILGKDVCLSHLHLEPENNAIPGRLPPLQSYGTRGKTRDQIQSNQDEIYDLKTHGSRCSHRRRGPRQVRQDYTNGASRRAAHRQNRVRRATQVPR